ncbi:MAG: hypothetical protein ACTHYC_13790 [Sphingobacterium sp.]
MNKIKDTYQILKGASALVVLLAALLMSACSDGTESSSNEVVDSLSQPSGNDGVPLDNLERSRDTDTVEQQVEPNSGVSMDNLNRTPEDDTTSTLAD